MDLRQIDSFLESPIFTLYDKQKESIKKLLLKQYALLLGQQGCGKTAVITYLIKCWLGLNLLSKVWIITKIEVIEKFKKELLSHIPELKEEDIVLFNPSSRNFFEIPGKIYICDYYQMKLAYYHYEEKSKRKKEVFPIDKTWGVILDECQAIKNVKSDMHKILYKNIKKCGACIGSSGTPIEKVEEVYSIFRVIDENILGMNQFTFLHRIAELAPGSFRILYYRQKGVEEIWRKINPSIIRMKKTDLVEVVHKDVVDIKVSMEGKFLEEYESHLNYLKAKLQRERYKNFKTIATLIHPLFNFIKRVDMDNPRFVKFNSLVRRLIPNEKLIIWDTSPDTIQRISDYYSGQGIKSLCIHGGVPKEFRAGIIKNFNETEDIRLLVVSSLTNKDAWEIPSRKDLRRAIYYTVPDRAIDYEQSMDRIHRINSEEDVIIYRMLLEGSIDEWLWDLLNYKVKLMKGFIGEKEYQEIEKSSLDRYFGISRPKIDEVGV